MFTASVPDWAIYWTLGHFLKPLANNYFAQISHIRRQFFKGVKIYHFTGEIILGQLLWTFGDFFLVTLLFSATITVIVIIDS